MAARDRNVIVVPSATALAIAAAERIVARIRANPARILICLTGGSSPKKLYELLDQAIYANQIPWDRVHWFIGDDRFLPAGDPLNNMSMARASFLDRHAPAGNVHAIPTESASVDDAARQYEAKLKAFYGSDTLDPRKPLFDVVLLGVGPDGHVASLFPGYPAIEETTRWVVGVPEANVTPFVPRVSLTLAPLCSCRELLFEMSGEGKRDIVTRVFAGEDLPGNRVHALFGETIWLCDKDALPENFGG